MSEFQNEYWYTNIILNYKFIINVSFAYEITNYNIIMITSGNELNNYLKYDSDQFQIE